MKVGHLHQKRKKTMSRLQRLSFKHGKECNEPPQVWKTPQNSVKTKEEASKCGTCGSKSETSAQNDGQ
jgi:hypothetical protein